MIERLRNNIIWVLVIAVVLIGVAFGVGFLVRDWPLITVDREFKIIEVLSLGFSIVLAFLIPFYINHFVDKANKVNDVVINEIDRYRDHLEEMHQRFLNINRSETLSDENKTELNVLCELLDTKFEVLNKIVKDRCKERADEKLTAIKDAHILYWRVLTGIGINSPDVTEIHPVIVVSEVQTYGELTEKIASLSLFMTNY